MFSQQPHTCGIDGRDIAAARNVMPSHNDIMAHWQETIDPKQSQFKARRKNFIRKVRINHYRPSQRSSNKFRSSPYTLWNFIPLFFKTQLSKPSNDIFIVIMILNYMPGITIVSKATAVIPVIFILSTSLLKDLIELIIRTRNDRVINKEEYTEHIANGKSRATVESQMINPGDIFKIQAGQTTPCDVLVLASANNVVYFSQSSLTGEQNLVQKRPIYLGSNVITTDMIGIVEFGFHRKQVIGCYTGPVIDANTDYRVTTFPEMPVEPVSVCIEDVQAIQRARERTYKNTLLSTRGIPLASVQKHQDINKTVSVSEPVLHSVIFNQTNVGFKGTTATTEYYALALATGKHCFSTYSAPKKEEHTPKSSRRLQIIIIVQCSLVLVFVISFSAVVAARYQSYINQYPYLHVAEQFSSKGAAFFISFVSYLILFSYALPICIFVTIELLNILNRIFIRCDLKITNLYGVCNVNNDKVLTNLSCVSHIFTDKTGTLTCNRFTYNTFLGEQECVKLSFGQNTHSFLALGDNTVEFDGANTVYGNYETTPDINSAEARSNRILQLVALGLCNSLIPVRSASKLEYFGESIEETCYLRHLSEKNILHMLEKTEKVVRLALSRHFIDTGNAPSASMGTVRLTETLSSDCVDECNVDEYYTLEFEVLKFYDFTPVLKRMSILCQQIQPSTNNIPGDCLINNLRPFLITKGSHTVMQKIMRAIQVQHEDTQQPLVLDIENVITRNLADKRCFVFAFKPFTTVPNIDTETQFSIEKSSKFLGISVIKDELAPNVFESIKKFKMAGIKVNIVTGDSTGTTIEIAKRTGIIDVGANIIGITSINHISEYALQLQDGEAPSYVLTVSGDVVDRVLPNLELKKHVKRFLYRGRLPRKFIKKNMEESGEEVAFNRNVAMDFMKLTSQADACLYCSMTPETKKLVVQYHNVYVSMLPHILQFWRRMFKKNQVCGGASLAIGDGQNDLQMIDAADISMGIRGREGMYVANNADISVASFSTLARLLLVQGPHIEQRIRMTIFYNLYKNTMLAIICGFYSGQSLFSGVLIINDFLSLMYNVILNFIPIFIYSLSEKHVKSRYLENCPTIYLENRQPWRYWIEFLSFYLSGVYMAIIIYFCTAFLFGNSAMLGFGGRVADTSVFSFIIITVITFVSLIRLMIASKYYSTAFAWSIIISIVLYYLTLIGINYTFFFTQYFYNTLTAASVSFGYYVHCLLMITFCLIPDVIYGSLSRLYFNPDPNSLLRHYFIKERKGSGKREDIQLELQYQRCLNEVVRSVRCASNGTKEQTKNAVFCDESIEVDVKQEYN